MTYAMQEAKRNLGIAKYYELRTEYLKRNINDKIKNILKKLGFNFVLSPSFNSEKADLWADVRFHLNNRLHITRKSSLTKINELCEVYALSKQHKEKLKQIIIDGVSLNGSEKVFYDLSLLPLNIALGKNVMQYFIPPIDYFDLETTNLEDPYGIITGKSRSKGFISRPTAIKSLDSKLLLGANKFTHTLLYNVDFYCPIGCSDCYKARMGTREYNSDFKIKGFVIDELGEVVSPTKSTVIEQARQTVKWLNHNERGKNIYDIIISGGEPLMLSNETIGLILSEFKEAENLKVLRICTGALFLGLPFRIDNELLQILRDFSDETGVRITIQAHIGNHEMISPESIIAIQKIKEFGFNIYAQVPIKNHVNFFLDDPSKTITELSLLLQKLVIADVEPYMFIVDMHPSTNQYYIPLEPLLQVWGDLVESHDFPGLEKPRTLSVLFEQGNIVLSGNTLFAITKTVDKSNHRITYKIPRVGVSGLWENTVKECFEYNEPLVKGINDNPNSLEIFRLR